MTAVRLVSAQSSKRAKRRNPPEDAEIRDKIESVLAEAKRRWPCVNDVPGRNKMSRILAADECVKRIGYTEHSVRKILGGDYPAARRLNIPGFFDSRDDLQEFNDRG